VTSQPSGAHVLFALLVVGCASPAQPDSNAITSRIEPAWQTDVGTRPTELSLAAITPSTVIVGGNSVLVGLDPKTGSRKWSLPVPFGLPQSGLVALSDSLAAIVTGDGFAIFDPRSGIATRVWKDPRPRQNPSSTIPQQLSDGRIVYASRSLHLLALNARTQTLDTLTRLPGDSARHAYVASLLVVNDTIYCPVASDAVRGAAFRNTMPYRFSVRNRVLDSLSPDQSDSASLSRWMIAQSDLLIGSTNYSEPSWLAFDRATGVRKWKVGATAGSLGPSSQIAVVGDTIFAGGNDGVGYVIHVPSGQKARTLVIPNGIVDGVVACGSDVIINVVGQMASYRRDGSSRTVISGLSEGKESFLGFFARGEGLAVIGNGQGLWIALPCATPN
jgi:outer membrane protein assembly factor BamB